MFFCMFCMILVYALSIRLCFRCQKNIAVKQNFVYWRIMSDFHHKLASGYSREAQIILSLSHAIPQGIVDIISAYSGVAYMNIFI